MQRHHRHWPKMVCVIINLYKSFSPLTNHIFWCIIYLEMRMMYRANVKFLSLYPLVVWVYYIQREYIFKVNLVWTSGLAIHQKNFVGKICWFISYAHLPVLLQVFRTSIIQKESRGIMHSTLLPFNSTHFYLLCMDIHHKLNKKHIIGI